VFGSLAEPALASDRPLLRQSADVTFRSAPPTAV
jgi:hypothetical protein